jgi:hypothetical protein
MLMLKIWMEQRVISNEQDLRSCFPVSVKVNRQLFLVVDGLPLTGLHAGSEESVNPVIVGAKKKTHSFARGERVCQTVHTATSLKCSAQGGGGRQRSHLVLSRALT